MGNEYDFIVVGGGTAGCAVAGRLAENPNVKVLVIEAGITNPGDIDAITTPARAFELRDSKWDWAYKTTMIDRPEYTRVEKPNTRGKVLGGSSCLNYYTWIPGSAATFDEWAAYGGDEWTWDKCKAYLYKVGCLIRKACLFLSRRSDAHCFFTSRPPTTTIKSSSPPRSRTSARTDPSPSRTPDLIPEIRPFRKALTEAWVSKGQPLTADVHNGTMRGLWKAMNSIYDGKRSSSWLYLVGKSNVTVLGKTHSKNLIIENGHAVGVVVIREDGTEESYKAKAEVIISSGVFEVAQAPNAEVVDSPHCGQNLLDHPILPHVFRLKDGYGLDHHLLRAGLEKDAAVSAYRWKNTGPYTSGLLELVGLPRIDDRLRGIPEYEAAKAANGGKDPFGPAGQPHFEIDFVPMFSDAFQWHIPTPPKGDYFTIIVDLLRPLSKTGTVTLNSTNALEQPKVNINFFAEDLDIVAMREGIRFVDDIIMNGDGMKDIIGEDYPWPMPRSSDEAMNKMILERSQTGFHPCGTARMGKDIKHGVVDGKLRVYGIQNLRVIDASVIPVIPDCRIQNSVYMIGEKGADMIKADHPELYG
ncbi:GMC oxidoreductase [Mycena venus]|uniref:GMC oxidoreductase n=1 Tax=Mycena venus TaxID=2733690 RepID=A0A8H6YG68_9AGAR|nr:GMC oxidoreductase [Mycena venus]